MIYLIKTVFKPQPLRQESKARPLGQTFPTWFEDVDEVAEDDPVLQGVLERLRELLVQDGLDPKLGPGLLHGIALAKNLWYKGS